jgi:hypothetical protein
MSLGRGVLEHSGDLTPAVLLRTGTVRGPRSGGGGLKTRPAQSPAKMNRCHKPRFGGTCPVCWLLLFALLFIATRASAATGATQATWWKGNLHTHSLWSDGDDYPEMIVEWYKLHGYDFLALSDHNVLAQGNKWIDAITNKGGAVALDNYLKRYGTNRVQVRETNGRRLVRLKAFAEYREQFEEPGRFLLIQNEEITDNYKSKPVHVNATNVRDLIKPQGGNSVQEVIQNNVNAVFEQHRRTGRPTFPHLNHPNFAWGVTAEDLMAVKNERFFEVYNGHPLVHNEGDDTHASTDRMWDIILTMRLTEFEEGVLYGLGVDDSHNYHKLSSSQSNPGRGWIVVRATQLTATAIIAAMETGDFYASSGVRLKDVRRGRDRYEVEIDPEAGVTYTTQFIGTRKGFDRSSKPVLDEKGEPMPVTRQYSMDIGQVLAEVKGPSANYPLKSDEIYVRARIISSKLKANPYVKGEFERAWTQPLVPDR